MGLLAQYGSDSEDGSDNEAPSAPSTSKPPIAKPTPAAPAFTAPPKPKAKKPLIIGSNSALLAKLGVHKVLDDDDDDEDGSSQGGAKKKAKLNDGSASVQQTGKGKSSLVDMLPPPKRALPKPAASPAPSTSSSTPAVGSKLTGTNGGSVVGKAPETSANGNGLMLPPNMRKAAAAKAKATEQEKKPAVPAAFDFFGLAAEPEPTSSTSALPPTNTSSITITSAPSAPDFVPPIPTASDPYPGYYQLPSGDWAAHDPEYYMSFFPSASSSAKEKAQQGMDKTWDAAEMGDVEGMESIDVMQGLQEQRRLAEERKKLTAPDLYSEENSYKAVGKTTGRAGQRHQLTALLKDAHANRAALEERIAANKRNKRESGTKYGF